MSADGLTFTNTYDGTTNNNDPTDPKTEEANLTATKRWAGIPVGAVTFPKATLTLYQNGAIYVSVTITNPVILIATGNGDQTAKWEKLAKFAPDGSVFVYTVKETALTNGYKATVSADGLTFINTYDGTTDNNDPNDPKTNEVNLTATKSWLGIPTGTTKFPKATLTLYQDGKVHSQTGVINPVELIATGNGDQTVKWEKLPKFSPDGAVYKYTVKETALSNGYKATVSADGLTFTNTYDGTTNNNDPTDPKTEETNLTATKVWANIPVGTTTFPKASLTLQQNGKAHAQTGLINPVVLTATGNGSQTAKWEKLPKFAPDGSNFIYTVKETALSSGYKATVSADGLTFTNTYDGTTNNNDPTDPKTEETNLTATKVWANIPVGTTTFPKAELTLIQNGKAHVQAGVTNPVVLIATGNGNQTAKWEKLPKFAPDGSVFAYTVKETALSSGYKATVSPDGLTFTNTYDGTTNNDNPTDPKTEETNITVTKVWANIPVGTTTFPKAELKLFQNGATFAQAGVINPVELTATGNGSQIAKWEKLPKFAPDGSNFVYTVKETALSSGYKATVSADGLTFTNTYDGTTNNDNPTDPKTEETNLAATKIWANIPAGTKTFPKAELKLFQNGKAHIQTGVTNPVVLTATGDGNQIAKWEKLPKFAPDGSVFAYTVKETALSSGYKATVSADGLTFTNTYDGATNNDNPNKPKTETTNLTATKRWVGIPDGTTMPKATFTLFQNAIVLVKDGVTNPIELTAAGNGSQTAKWDNLLKFAPDGTVYAYTVKETKPSDGYKMTVSADGLMITNTFIEVEVPTLPRTGERGEGTIAYTALLLALAALAVIKKRRADV